MMANIGFTRFVTALNNSKSVLQSKISPNKVFSRKSSHGYFGYRELNYEPNRPYIQRLMHFNAGLMWCYIFWCFKHNWSELTGEKIWPNRDEWSDEHLGIPPDQTD